MQAGKFEKAHTAFNKMLATSPGDLADRIRMYINACLQQAAKGKNQLRHPRRALRLRHLPAQRRPLRRRPRAVQQSILKTNDKADYAFYGLAVLSSMTGDPHTCLEHLTEAIRQNPRNRIQARADSDFQDMADDPRFTELLYPEV